MDINQIYSQARKRILDHGALSHGSIYLETEHASYRIALRDPHRAANDKLMSYFFQGKEYKLAHPEIGEHINCACLIEETSYVKKPGISYYEEDRYCGNMGKHQHDCLAMQIFLDGNIVAVATDIPRKPNGYLGIRLSVHFSCIERKPLYAFLAGMRAASIPESFFFRYLFSIEKFYERERGVLA